MDLVNICNKYIFSVIIPHLFLAIILTSTVIINSETDMLNSMVLNLVKLKIYSQGAAQIGTDGQRKMTFVEKSKLKEGKSKI